MKTALIISGGDRCKLNKDITYDYCIACDKGAIYAKEMGIKPDVIIGDFDSYEGNISTDFPDVEILKYPVMKDDTDTMLCIKHALSLHFGHIVIICALGSRMDHTISNIQSLYYISSHGGVGEIYSDTEHMRTLSSSDGELTLSRRESYSLSLFSLSDTCTGLSINGSKYDVEDAVLTSSFPLGHGNSFVDDTVTISIASGNLLIVESNFSD